MPGIHSQVLEMNLHRELVGVCLASGTTSDGGSVLLLDSRARYVDKEFCFVAGRHEDELAVTGILMSVFPRRQQTNSISEPDRKGDAGKCSSSLDQFVHRYAA